MRSYDYEIWDVVLNGPYVPMKIGTGVEASIPKLQSEWSESKVKRVQVNFKAINTLHCAKEIWDKLKVTYEGTSQVKESKIALLSN